MEKYWAVPHIKSTATTDNNHQKWIINVHKQVKAAPQFIDNFIHDNMIRHSKTVTQHNYLTKMAKKIIDDDTGKEFNYRQLSKHPKHKKICKQLFANEIGRLSQGAGGRVDGTDNMFFIAKYQVSKGRLKDVMYGCVLVYY